MKGAGGGIDVGELPTGAIYPEVRELLERPDRIRREAFKLLDHPEARLERAPSRAGFVWTTYRTVNGLGSMISIAIEEETGKRASFSSHPAALAMLREEIFLKLVEILEADPAIQ